VGFTIANTLSDNSMRT
ncbi:hypothetical protein D041_0489B, partial [Vibrio parahaemolyticus EKP-008]